MVSLADSGGTDETAAGESGDGDRADDDGQSYVAEEHVELELNDRFELDDLDVGFTVTGTEKLDPETLDAAVPSGRAPYVVEMLVENETEESAAVGHGVFWLEGLDPGEDRPDTDLSAPLEDGATGDATRLDPREERTLKLAFAIPEEFEPQYLWAEQYYVCLV